MAKRIVDRFEMVDIEDNAGEIEAPALRHGKGPAALLHERPARQNSGQRIARCMRAQLQFFHGKIGQILQDGGLTLAELSWRIADSADAADVVTVTGAQGYTGVEPDVRIVPDVRVVGKT